MIGMRSLVNMVATDAVEELRDPEDRKERADNLPPINYRLELIQEEDGRLVWYE